MHPPFAVPSAKEDADLAADVEIFDVPGETFPSDCTRVESLFDGFCVAKIHPMNQELERRRIGERKEDNRVIGGTRQGTRNAVWRNDPLSQRARFRRRRRTNSIVDEIKGRGAAEQASQQTRLSREIVHMQLNKRRSALEMIVT